MRNLDAAKELLLPYLPEAIRSQGLSDVFYMLTSVRDETTYMIYDGEHAEAVLRTAFPGCKLEGDAAVLPGVVSRKKQVLPAISGAFSQI